MRGDFIEMENQLMPSFSNEQIKFDVLRQRAFNLRWATVSQEIIPLTAADPDFPVAHEIRKAILDYTEEGVFSYGPPEGLPEFRRVAAQVLTQRKKIPSDSGQILAVDGAAAGMFVVARSILKPGDEALIFDPVDFLFRQSVEAAGAKAIYVPMDRETGAFDLAALWKAITPRTRLIGICNPHNPIGRMMTRQELQIIGELAVEHDLWIMNDEVWSDIVFPPHSHFSMASLGGEIAQKTISVFGFSKTFGLAGLRVGFVHAPTEKIFESLIQASRARSTSTGVSTLSQIAATAAYEKCWYWVDAFLAHLLQARDYTHNRLSQMPGVKCRKPDGTYVIFPDLRAYGLKSEQMADYLLKEAKVAVVPGAPQWFGPGAEGHIRLCFSTSLEVLREALDRIEEALSALPLTER